jgi:hypothetical protein
VGRRAARTCAGDRPPTVTGVRVPLDDLDDATRPAAYSGRDGDPIAEDLVAAHGTTVEKPLRDLLHGFGTGTRLTLAPSDVRAIRARLLTS